MRLTWFVLLAFVIISMFAVHASADSIIIRPTDDYNVHLDTQGSSSNYQCVDDVTSDGDSTYVYNSQDGDIVDDLYNIDTLTSFPDDPNNATIQNVTVYQISRKDISGNAVESHGQVRANGSTNKKDGNIYSTSYQTFSSVWTTNPGTGSAWEWCDFTNSNFMFGVEIYNVGGSYGRCTQCWVEINYNISSVNEQPVASFTYSTNGLTINVDGSGSTDSDGTIVSYQWDWTNDGSYDDTGVTQSYTYGTNGTYNVTLRVTDNDSATNTTTQQITVTNTSGGSSGFSSDFSWTTIGIVVVTAGVIGGLAAYSAKRSKG